MYLKKKRHYIYKDNQKKIRQLYDIYRNRDNHDIRQLYDIYSNTVKKKDLVPPAPWSREGGTASGPG